MKMIKCLMISLTSMLLLLLAVPASAAPPDAELNQYLAEIGWTKAELMEYLGYYEIPIDDFSTVEELKTILGTPINDTNLQDLLVRYELTEQELRELLGHFGDDLNGYKFIEDLEASVEFYVNHDSYMADVEDELKKIGITEEETEKLFTYLASVEEKFMSQLDETSGIDARLEKFLSVDDSSDLSDADLDELASILEETIALYEIDVKFRMNNQAVSLKQLLAMKEINADIAVSIFAKSGELLMDYKVPQTFIESLMALDEGEELLHVGELSDEYVDHMHDEKAELAERELK